MGSGPVDDKTENARAGGLKPRLRAIGVSAPVKTRVRDENDAVHIARDRVSCGSRGRRIDDDQTAGAAHAPPIVRGRSKAHGANRSGRMLKA